MDKRKKLNKPNFMLKSYNYFKAVSKRVLGGFENVDTLTYYDRANECGCPIETKAAWKTEKCPKDKW
jgi:hypothetical protein